MSAPAHARLALAGTAAIMVLCGAAPPVLVPGGIYDKPFMKRDLGRTLLGGYAEAQFRYEREAGVSDGVTFLLERLNLFTFTPVSERVRLATEIEIEEGGEEVKIELAILDFEIHPAVTMRAGMLLSPLGRFNLSHDSPANPLTDRPLVSTELIPSTLSEPGAGFYGHLFPSPSSRVSYELYAVNGFDEGVLDNDEGGTRIPPGRGNLEDENRHPSLVGRIAASPRPSWELGVSAHAGPYSRYRAEGAAIDERRDLVLVALDGEARRGRLSGQFEWARARIDVPANLRGLYAESQEGLYLQLAARLLENVAPALPGSHAGVAGRVDLLDLDTRVDGDSRRRFTVGLQFHPSAETVFKLDYQRERARDRFDNPTDAAALLFSLATYF